MSNANSKTNAKIERYVKIPTSLQDSIVATIDLNPTITSKKAAPAYTIAVLAFISDLISMFSSH
jgi:hypothetical protein